MSWSSVTCSYPTRATPGRSSDHIAFGENAAMSPAAPGGLQAITSQPERTRWR
jgi:hypothetical protein